MTAIAKNGHDHGLGIDGKHKATPTKAPAKAKAAPAAQPKPLTPTQVGDRRFARGTTFQCCVIAVRHFGNEESAGRAEVFQARLYDRLVDALAYAAEFNATALSHVESASLFCVVRAIPPAPAAVLDDDGKPLYRLRPEAGGDK